MKREKIIAMLAVAAIAAPFQAGAQTAIIQDVTEFAKVLNYSPIPGPQIARQVCTPVTVVHERGSGNSVGGAVVGGILGALAGHSVGGGNARNATAVAGAVAGAMAGESLASGPTTSVQQQCTTLYEPGPPAGYQVTFDYKGKLMTTTTRMPPGEYLRIHNRMTIE